jgi:hypothetical protein
MACDAVSAHDARAAAGVRLRHANRGKIMRLNAPTQVVFIISLIIAVLALIGHFVRVPFVTDFQFWFAMVAYIVLAAACVLTGV